MVIRWVVLAIVLVSACSGSQVAVDDLQNPPKPSDSDAQYKDAYRMLDGTWKGTFNIYVDTRGQTDGPARPESFDPELWGSAPYKLSSSIDVTQVYTSESPYFQRVKITDRYPNGDVVESEGVNKVQDGKLYCVVKKPDDLVIHDGVLEGADTILWQRDRMSPKAVEFFRETVSGDTYRIVGWGYYGSDDVTKAPRMFFDASYERQL